MKYVVVEMSGYDTDAHSFADLNYVAELSSIMDISVGDLLIQRMVIDGKSDSESSVEENYFLVNKILRVNVERGKLFLDLEPISEREWYK
ncbi:hypothetical protein HCA00_02425 [Listeria booriae]|uniref:hypothetical protein n=1 Tax=Listeria booriae TaxID=1552123 RepID=UPI0016292A4C|nr:hypothetical protein [Listeria booriae]MBC2256963.1 hypothetical protein [Listeria booriae]MBC6127641.1 hypothetical protein [Listeria booriae]